MPITGRDQALALATTSAGANPGIFDIALHGGVDLRQWCIDRFLDAPMPHAAEIAATPVGGGPVDAAGLCLLVLGLVGKPVFGLAANVCHDTAFSRCCALSYFSIGTHAPGFLVSWLVIGKLARRHIARRRPAQTCTACVPGQGLEADLVREEVKRVHLVEGVHDLASSVGQ